MTLTFDVPGIPVAQGRGRAVRIGPGVRVIDPEKSRDWKRTVHFTVAQHTVHIATQLPLQDALEVVLDFRMMRPKSLPKRVEYHTKRPDIDNCTKAILDALNGLLYRDDSQIVKLTATKRYADRPGVEIRVQTLEEPPHGGAD